MVQDLVFIVLMIRRKRFDDLIMIQQPGGIPGILRQDQIHLLQHLQSSERNILQITNGRRNNIEQNKKLIYRDLEIFHDRIRQQLAPGFLCHLPRLFH